MQIRFLKYYLVLFCLVTGTLAFTQEIRKLNNLRFQFQPLEHGSREIQIDSDGFLWIGTKNGVVQYDGYTYRFTKENPLDSLGFKGTTVNAIFEDHEGGIWVGTNKGVNYKAPGHKEFVNLMAGPNPIVSITETEDNSLWLSGVTELFKIRNENGEWIQKVYPVPENRKISKLLTLNNQKLLAAGTGCYEIDYENVNSPAFFNLIVEDTIREMIPFVNNASVLLTNSEVIFLNQENEIIRKKGNIPKSFSICLHFDKSGVLWLGFDAGFVRIELDEEMNPQKSEWFRCEATRSIIEDQSGNLFFAQSESGLLKLGKNYDKFTYITFPEEFKESYAFKIVEDNDGNYWIGTFEGLLFYNTQTAKFKTYKPENGDNRSLPHPSVYAILNDRKERIWIATGDGVVLYNKKSDHFIRLNQKGLSHHLALDKEEFIWFVANDILYKANPENLQVTSFESIDGSKQIISQFFIDSGNLIWAWNINKGLQVYKIENGQPVPDGNVILPSFNKNELANWMIEDDTGRIWLSKGVGIFLIDKKLRKPVKFLNSTNSALQQDYIFDMVKDLSGNIWIKQFAFGSISINPVDFSVRNLNPSFLYNTIHNNYSCIAAMGRDGKLFTDGNGEIIAFYPDSIAIDSTPPKVVLEEITINNKVAESIPENLKYSENNINFKFAGIQFDDPQKNLYSFYLNGHDAFWVQASKNREAFYSALKPGDYSFYVKSANSDGIWSKPAMLASFTISPPWWLSFWAYVFYILLIASLAFGFYRLQLKRKLALAEVKKLNEIDEFKNQFFNNISHEFRTPLTVISGLAQKLETTQGTTIKRNAEQIHSLVNQILELGKIEADAVKLKREKLEIISFTRYLLFSFSSLAEEKSISLQFISNPDHLIAFLDSEKYSHILNNLLTNAIKYTPEHGRIILSINKIKNQLEIKVEDTGIGMEEKDLPFIFNRYYQTENQQTNWKGTGIGLALTKQLVELMGGNITVSSEIGKGTVFKVLLPLNMDETSTEAEAQPYIDKIPSETYEEKIQVLLIEDNEDITALIRGLLEDFYQVYTANNGIDGIKKAVELVPDIVISDVKMPGKDGLEVTQALKSDSRTSHIPIILTTAKTGLETRLAGLSYGAEAYIPKPFNNEELLLTIKNLLRVRESLRSRYSGDEPIQLDSNYPEDKFIASLQNLVLQNLAEDSYGIPEICKDLAVSRTQLHRKIKTLTGRSSSIFVRDIRLAEGRKMIRRKAGTIAEIAYSTGFSDPNYFSRLYADKYGYPPTKENLQKD